MAISNLPPGKAGPGRPKGSQNKSTVLIKEALLQSLSDSEGGAVGYFNWLKIQHPPVFGTLVGKIMPAVTELSGPDGSAIQVSKIELVAAGVDSSD